MKLLDIIFINFKKLKVQTKNALYLILPVSILMILGVVITSQVENIRAAMSTSVFDTVMEQSRLILLQKDSSTGGFDMMRRFSGEDTEFTEADLSTILEIDGVESAQINESIPIQNIKTDSLFEDKRISLSSVVGLEDGISSLYTDSDFTFTEGQPIPIIINAVSLIETYEDWQGKTEIEIDMRSMMGNREPGDGTGAVLRDSFSPIKTRAVEYDKDSLLGSEFTIEFGGLDDIQTYTMDRGDSGSVFKKLTEEDIETKRQERESAISEYWDYEKISTPLSYTFVIVGVIENENNRDSYIPADFVDELMVAYFANQSEAKNETEIGLDLLGSTFTGLTYDGLELGTSFETFITAGMRGGFGGGMRGEEPTPDVTHEIAETSISSSSYNIPGLVIETDTAGETVGIYSGTDAYSLSVRNGSTMNIYLSSIEDRADVVAQLNKLGYAYQDLSDVDVFANLESTLRKLSTGFLFAFVILVAGVVILTMSKFVSDSTKEIGIFRAMGVTKAGISTLFLSQSLLYTCVALVSGVALGLLTNLVMSGVVNTWFEKFIAETVAESYSVVYEATPGIFLQINWQAVATYSGILMLITLVTSLIPAYKASSISPVEAIKDE